MKERDFQRWVCDVADRMGWRWWHVPAAMRAVGVGGNVGFVGAREAAGLPDLILMHDDPPRLLFVECKGETGWSVTKQQREFLKAAQLVADSVRVARLDEDGPTYNLHERPMAAYVWRPGMEEQIEVVLKTRMLT